MTRIIVVGGDAAGMSAASKARRVLPEAEIVVYEAGSFVSYSACGIPFYVSGTVKEFDDLLHYPVSKFIDERNIDVRTESNVTGVNIAKKEITVECRGQKATDIYDRLIIATGARPKIPEMFSDLARFYTMRNLDDLKRLMKDVKGKRKIAVIGGGYVGVEMSEAFTELGARVSLFQRSGSLLRGMDMEFSDKIRKEMEVNGVTVYLDSPVTAVHQDEDGITTITAGDVTDSFDFLFIATGVTPNSEFADGAGLRKTEFGAIIVDSNMRTSVPDVYAAGDVATTYDMITGRQTYFPLATGSNKSGRVAGNNAAGGSQEYRGIARTEVIKVFSLAIGKTGFSSSQALGEGFTPVEVTISATSRASYYPGSEPLRIKLIADRETQRVLGCIILGKDGVAKRVDVVAAAISGNLTVEDMAAIDYSYSPPFAPAWEPLGVAADVLMKKL